MPVKTTVRITPVTLSKTPPCTIQGGVNSRKNGKKIRRLTAAQFFT